MPTLSIASLHRVTAAVFIAAGAPADVADHVAQTLVDNHLAGHDSHGILRIPQYVASIRAGDLVPAARPTILEETATTALVSGNWAFGQVTATFAADLATDKAQRERVAAVSVVQASHTGRLAAFTERAARRNVAMFMAVGTVGQPMTAPYGGAAAVFGTNPVAFSLPNGEGPPVTLDYATSAIAAGKVKVAKAKHEPLPPGTVVTRDGLPTTDPEELFKGGALLPFGGHKGYALAVIAELLGGPLTGADAYPGVVSRSGIFMFAVASDAFRPQTDYQQAVSRTAARIRGVPPAAGFEDVLLPGEPEARARTRRLRDGIPIPEETWREVCAVAEAFHVDIASMIL
ncbi:MAG: Ldh family oxidoreductase [Nitriliruptorales bacterium]|nr:Ldh family oxidoreductase [Nitriliruptorales bacterium]